MRNFGLPTIFGALMIVFSPQCAFSQTHCAKDERDYFSCQIRSSHKVVSLCGGGSENESAQDAWIQYRFGKLGKPELIYPPSKLDSKDKFEGNYFHPHGEDHQVIDVRFINNGTLYGVDLNDTYDKRGKRHIAGGVNVQNDKTNRNLFCSREVQPVYWDRLLNMPTGVPGKETDFLADFYRAHGK